MPSWAIREDTEDENDAGTGEDNGEAESDDDADAELSRFAGSIAHNRSTDMTAGMQFPVCVRTSAAHAPNSRPDLDAFESPIMAGLQLSLSEHLRRGFR